MHTRPRRTDILHHTAARIEREARTGRTSVHRYFDSAVAVAMLRILARLEKNTNHPVDARIPLPAKERARAREEAFARVQHGMETHGSIPATVQHVTDTIDLHFRTRRHHPKAA